MLPLAWPDPPLARDGLPYPEPPAVNLPRSFVSRDRSVDGQAERFGLGRAFLGVGHFDAECRCAGLGRLAGDDAGGGVKFQTGR